MNLIRQLHGRLPSLISDRGVASRSTNSPRSRPNSRCSGRFRMRTTRKTSHLTLRPPLIRIIVPTYRRAPTQCWRSPITDDDNPYESCRGAPGRRGSSCKTCHTDPLISHCSEAVSPPRRVERSGVDAAVPRRPHRTRANTTGGENVTILSLLYPIRCGPHTSTRCEIADRCPADRLPIGEYLLAITKYVTSSVLWIENTPRILGSIPADSFLKRLGIFVRRCYCR